MCRVSTIHLLNLERKVKGRDMISDGQVGLPYSLHDRESYFHSCSSSCSTGYSDYSSTSRTFAPRVRTYRSEPHQPPCRHARFRLHSQQTHRPSRPPVEHGPDNPDPFRPARLRGSRPALRSHHRPQQTATSN